MNKPISKKILFISHEATLSGAPWVLFHLLGYIKQHTNWECRILFLEAGETLKDFQELFPCDVWESVPKDINGKIRYYAKSRIGIDKNAGITRKYKAEKFDLIYANSVVSLKIASFLQEQLQKPLISHIHELGFALQTYYQEWLTDAILKTVSHFLVVSRVAFRDFTGNWPIDKDQVTIVNSFIDIEALKRPHRSRQEVLKELFLLDDSFIVGNCGLSSWWKGTDIFIQVAAEVNKRKPYNTIKFIWVGNEPEVEKNKTRYDMQRLGVTNNVLFVGRKENSAEYLQLLDLYFMSSRADSLGIASIEAALLEKPILCFEDSGGIVEFVDEKIGYKISYLDIQAVADKIIELSSKPTELAAKGALASVKAQKYDVSANAPLIIDLISKYLN